MCSVYRFELEFDARYDSSHQLSNSGNWKKQFFFLKSVSLNEGGVFTRSLEGWERIVS